MGKLSARNEPGRTACLRVLCLGNELLADDAFGFVVAEKLRALPEALQVVESSLSGLALIDELTNASCLLVIDSVQTGNGPPGTIHICQEDEWETPAGPSPHYFGIFETLRLARKLRLPAPEKVMILAVETADCTTLGGSIHPAVLAAVPKVVQQVREIAQGFSKQSGE